MQGWGYKSVDDATRRFAMNTVERNSHQVGVLEIPISYVDSVPRCHKLDLCSAPQLSGYVRIPRLRNLMFRRLIMKLRRYSIADWCNAVCFLRQYGNMRFQTDFKF